MGYLPWHMHEEPVGWRPLNNVETRLSGKNILALFAAEDDRSSAARWAGREIAVPRRQLPSLNEGEYYWADLLGLEVSTLKGVILGKITSFIETGANDVLVVQGKQGECLIPYVKGSVVHQIDMAKRIMRVDWDTEF